MYGVDSKAHRTCLESGGRTIAVFGCGLDVLCPAENSRLYSDILAGGGLVLSEYENKRKPERWMFPQRNRIVAGLSKGVLVIEGGGKSGSLITARIGFKQNKPVMAVPGPITSSLSKGTNWLIRNGATLVTSAAEILETLNIDNDLSVNSAAVRAETEDEQQVLEELGREELGVDELARKLGKNAAEMGVLLSMMSLKGLVAEKEGKYVIQ
jgi:DNA processing protein